MDSSTGAPFTLRYPLQVGNDGGLATDSSVGSQVRLVFTVNPSQRLDDTEYGMPVQQFEQSSLQLDAGRMLILYAVQRALLRYVPEIQLLGLDAYRVVSERRLALEVGYTDRMNFQRPQRILLGLGLKNLGG